MQADFAILACKGVGLSAIIWDDSGAIVRRPILHRPLGPSKPQAMLDNYFREYGLIAIFIVVAIGVPISMLMMSSMAGRIGLRPNNPTEIKSDTYECGVEPIGGRWELFNFRYYMFAILFVIFDVEVVFLYPWAAKFQQLELFALIEMAVFVGILLVGLAYAWRKNDLEWG